MGLGVVSLSIGLFASTYIDFRWNIYIFSENISMEKNLFFGVQLCSSKCFEKHFQGFGLYEKIIIIIIIIILYSDLTNLI